MRHATHGPRRAAAIAVLAVSTVALVATSPPMEPQHRIGGQDSATARLTIEAPITRASLTIEANDEALWSDDPAAPVLSARLTAQAGILRGAADQPSLDVDAPILRVILLDPAGEPLVRDDRAGPSWTDVDFRASCQEPRDCTVTYTMLVEWLNPTDEPLEAVLSATVETVIEGPEVSPPGAEARVAFGPVESAGAMVIRGDLAVESTRLSAERPMVSWTFTIAPTEATETVRLGWPIEARGTMSLFVGVPGAEAGQFTYRQPPVSVVLVGEQGEIVLGAGDGRNVHALDPFVTCGDTPCSQEYTLVAAWEGDGGAPAVDLGWAVDAGIAFLEDEAAPPGADVTIRMDGQMDVVAEGESLRASAAGTLEVSAERYETRSTIVRLIIPAAAVEPELIGGPIPAVIGTLTASSTSARDIGDQTRITLRASPEGQPAALEVPAPEAGSATVRFRPAPMCRSGAPCAVDIGLTGSASRTGGRVDENARLVIAWELEVALVYPNGVRVPVGVEILLADGTP